MPEIADTKHLGNLLLKPASGQWSGSEQLCRLLGYDSPQNGSIKELQQHLNRDDLAALLGALQTRSVASNDQGLLRHKLRLLTPGGQVLPSYVEGFIRFSPAPESYEFSGSLLLPAAANSDGASAISLLDQSGDMLAMLDTTLHYRSVNEQYARLFGKPPASFIGTTIAEAFAHDPDHYRKVVEPILQGCLEQQPTHYESWVEIPAFGRLYIDLKYTPVMDEFGEVCGIAIVGRDRTEAMLSLEALQRSEKLLKRAESIAHLGGWTYDVNSQVLRWTDEMYEIHEVARDFAPGHESINALFPPHEHQRLQHNLELNLQGRSTDTIAKAMTPGGKSKWVRSLAFPVMENGRVTKIDGILQDVTELTQMQLRLSESEEKYRSLVEETNALVWEARLSPLQLSYVSPQVEKMTGYNPEDWCQPGFLEKHLHPEDLEYVLESARRNTRRKQDFVLEHRVMKADGSDFWVHDEIKLIYNDQGKLLKLRGVMVDISRMKEMQRGLNHALRRLENQKFILDQHAIVSTTDRAGNITYANEKFIQISGYEREELLGRNHRMLKSGLHDAQYYAKLWGDISSGQIWQGEICNRRKDGSLYWVYSTILPLLDEKGRIEEYISVRTDISELKHTEASLRRAQKMEAIGQLTGGIAHDFNNLLGVVIGNLELIEMGIPHRENLLTQVQNAKNAAMRGSVLTRRLLNFSHQSPVQGKTLDLNRVLTGLEVLVSKSLTAQVKVEMELDRELWQVEADPGDFEDLVINLALNANDAMPGGGTLRFTTTNHEARRLEFHNNGILPPGQYVRITIADNGIGMDPEVLEKIFEPYFTTKPSDKGSGLGLAMVYGFVKRSKGLISVESIPDRGTTFTIFLPRSRQQEAEPEQPQPRVSSPGELPRARRHETILLVDDEIEILKITRTNLENLGYRVLSGKNGEEALEVLKGGEEIDLMFTDIVMPGRLNGYELAEAALKLRPDLKVLFTTGYAKVETKVSREDWREAMIQKPYRSTELSRKIRATLDTSAGM